MNDSIVHLRQPKIGEQERMECNQKISELKRQVARKEENLRIQFLRIKSKYRRGFFFLTLSDRFEFYEVSGVMRYHL